jgi:Dolichyl-phosphate-mannose-protein mannosyltransferase
MTPALTGTSAARRCALVALAAFLLYAPAFWWGAPYATSADRTHAWGVDDETPLGSLAQVHGIVAPRPGQNVGYALLHSLLVSASYVPYLGALWLGGDLAEPVPTYPYGLDDPARSLRILGGISHFLSVLMGVVCVIGLHEAARAAWDSKTALLAALFGMTVFPMFYYARTGNVDVPMLAFASLALASYARCLAGGLTAGRGAWLGLFAGCALATKESALGALLGLALGLALNARRPSLATPAGGVGGFWRAAGTGLATSFAAFGLGSGLLLAPGRYLAHVAELSERVAIHAQGGIGATPGFPFTIDGHLALARAELSFLIDCLNPIGFALCVVGSFLSLRFDGRVGRRMLLPALGYAAYMFLLARGPHLRYTLITAFLLVPFGARAIAIAWERGPRFLSRGVAAAAALALALALARGASLTLQMLRDSRYEAGTWLAARLGPGDVVGFFGASQNLPPLPAGIESRRFGEFLGMYQLPSVDRAAADRIANELAQASPRFIVVIPDHTSLGLPHSRVLPPASYQALESGELGYRRAALFRTPDLLAFARPPALDYPTVNPPIRVFERIATSRSERTD